MRKVHGLRGSNAYCEIYINYPFWLASTLILITIYFTNHILRFSLKLNCYM